MVVKAIRGRRRYVTFILGERMTKDVMEKRISSTGYVQIRVIQCAGGWCILRCEPRLLDRIQRIMDTVSPGSVSVATSGNLSKLRRRFPVLWDTRPRYIAFTCSIDGRILSKSVERNTWEDGPEVKFCESGYAVLKCVLKDSDRTKEMVALVDPGSKPFLSSYDAKDLMRGIGRKEPALKSVLSART